MANLTRNQLQYAYSWTAIRPDDPRVTGIPDSTFLNRHEGYEMLSFLNRWLTDNYSALKAERLIRTIMPSTIRSHTNVVQWLRNNLNAYV